EARARPQRPMGGGSGHRCRASRDRRWRGRRRPAGRRGQREPAPRRGAADGRARRQAGSRRHRGAAGRQAGAMVDAMTAGRTIAAISLLLVPIAISQFLISLDFSCMTMVIPLLAKATGAAPALLQWTVSGSALVWGGCLILGGRIADRFGHRRIFAIGLA